jgi:hypothetical protein
MKVRASVKRICEHCKLSGARVEYTSSAVPTRVTNNVKAE